MKEKELEFKNSCQSFEIENSLLNKTTFQLDFIKMNVVKRMPQGSVPQRVNFPQTA